MPRIVKENHSNYTNISNQLVRDERLSWKARGIFLYLWSQADNWQFYVSEIATHATDGERSLRSGLKELERFGYLKRVHTIGEHGGFDGMDWYLNDQPKKDLDLAKKQESKNKTQKEKKPDSSNEESKPTKAFDDGELQRVMYRFSRLPNVDLTQPDANSLNRFLKRLGKDKFTEIVEKVINRHDPFNPLDKPINYLFKCLNQALRE